MPITKQLIESTALDVLAFGKAKYIYDDTLRGFGLRVGPKNDKYPNHKISYFVEKRAGGRGSKKFRYVYAQYPDLDLVQARNQAISLIAQVRQGIDISAKRKELLKLRETQLIQYKTTQLKPLMDDYIKVSAAKSKQKKGKDSKYWLKDVPSLLANHIYPKINHTTPVVHLDKDTLRATLKAISSPDLGNKAYSLLSTFFKYLHQESIITTNPMLQVSAQHEKPLSRNRVLSLVELKAYWQATEEMINSNYRRTQIFGLCYRLLLLTAQRRDDCGEMAKDELNLDNCTWEIPGVRAKNGHPHLVYLPPLAIEIVNRAMALSSCEYLFSAIANKPISGHSDAKKHLDKFMQKYMPIGEVLKPWHIHDIRSTFATICAGKLKINDDLCDRVLNHVNHSARSGVKYVYQKYNYWEERIEVQKKWCEYLEKLF